jgi:DNA-binding CsgD family transcriptional regulator
MTDVPSAKPRGRESELAAILRALNQVHEPRLIVSGPALSGRTTLLREVATATQADGRTVVECSGRPDLARIAAQVNRGPAGAVVVCWDDPPWKSAHFACRLDQIVTDAAAGWVFSHRGDTARRPLPIGADIWVDLTPLPSDAVVGIATDRFGAPPAGALTELLRVAAGSPGILHEVITGLLNEGLVRIHRGRTQLASARLPDMTAVRIRRTIATMSAQARQLVNVAAMVEVDCDVAELAELLDTTVLGMVPALAEATVAGIFRGDTDRLAFNHDLIRQLVVASIPNPARRVILDRTAHLRSDGQGAPTTLANLTPAERRTADLVRLGFTNHQVARRLHVSPHTVNYHLRQVYQKLRINSRVQLAAMPWTSQPPMAGKAPYAFSAAA